MLAEIDKNLSDNKRDCGLNFQQISDSAHI